MSYAYRGSGDSLSEGEAAARLTGRVQTAGAGAPPRAESRGVRGAVRVAAFPDPSKYPFGVINADGGIWRIDPAEFKTKAETIRAAAKAWAKAHGLTVKVVIDGGLAYVQFKGDTPDQQAGRRAVLEREAR